MQVEREANRCKGACFLGFRDVIRERYGEAVWLEVVGRLDGELRAALTNDVLVANGWYALGWYAQLHRVAREVLATNGELARDVGRLSTYRDLRSGPRRVLVELLSPQALVRNAHRVFGSYYESGRLTVDEAVAGRARARWSRCRDFDRNIWEDVFGGCVGALEAAGARDIRLERVAGGEDGDEDAAIVATWG